MKHCPACNFIFPDFHKVCDFDGTELIPDAERLALVRVPRPQTRFQRTLKSPVLWAGALLMFVLSSAFLVAYLEATTVQSPASAEAEPSPASSVDARSTAVISDHVPADRETSVVNRASRSRNPLKSKAGKARRQAIASRSVQQREQSTSSVRSQRIETFGRGDIPQAEMKSSRQVSEDKEPKLTAALKTTWRILKKPFKF